VVFDALTVVFDALKTMVKSGSSVSSRKRRRRGVSGDATLDGPMDECCGSEAPAHEASAAASCGKFRRQSGRSKASIESFTPSAITVRLDTVSDGRTGEELGSHAEALTPLPAPEPLSFSERMKLAKEKKQALSGASAYSVQAKAAGVKVNGLKLMAQVAKAPATFSSVVVRDQQTGEVRPPPWMKPRSQAELARLESHHRRRPVHEAALIIRNSKTITMDAATPTASSTASASTDATASTVSASITVDSNETKSPFYLDTMEQMLVRAQTVTTMARPSNRLLPQRVSTAVRLMDEREAMDDEQSNVWIEHLSTGDFDQDVAERTSKGSSISGGAWFGAAAALAYDELSHLAKSFHTRGQRVARETHDKWYADAVTIEFGWSTFRGGAKMQMRAWKNGAAYERKATAIGREKALGRMAEEASRVAWDCVLRRYPQRAAQMLMEVGRYGIYETGFSKVTIAYDNPTCAHYDSNYGADVILAFRLGNLRGGEHVMLSADGTHGIVVETSELGTLIAGCHEHLLHGNLATVDGGRLVFAFYLPLALLKEAPNRFAPVTRVSSHAV
jgi:hypothetical protein